MAPTRLEILRNLVAQNPGDSFSRYGLAMEYRSTGNLEAAAEEFRSLIAVNADYTAAYFQGGQTLERLGRMEEARALYRAGIDTASRKGEQHARDEMQAALDVLNRVNPA